MLELRRFERGGKLKPVEIGCVSVQRDLRHAFVRLNDIVIIDLERLVLRDADAAVPISVGPREVVVLRQHRFGRFSDIARKVRNVVVVRNTVVINIERKLVTLIVRLDAHAVAAFVRFAVVGHPVEVDLPFEVVVLQARLVAEHQTAFGHDAGCERVVVVGREVEVVGDREIHTARRAHAVGRREKARAAFIADRECEPGRAENRYAHEVQARARTRSGLVVLVDLEFVELDEPSFVVSLAGRNCHVLERGVVAREKLHVSGTPANIARCVFILGIGHFA